MQKLIQYFEGKSICILGFGLEGKSTLSFLQQFCNTKEITIRDESEVLGQELSGVKYITGKNFNLNFYEDIIMRSPGILLNHSERKNGSIISSQTALLLKHYKNKIIGVTGTKGKSTTASMIFYILKEAGKRVELVGNINKPSFDVIKELEYCECIVCELSSFQLFDVKNSPHIAVLQNIVPAHLDKHVNIEEYFNAKMNIIRFQEEDDIFIYNKDYEESLQNPSKNTKAEAIAFNVADSTYENYPTLLKGDFNKVNIIPGIIIANRLGIEECVIKKAVSTFKPLAHRMQSIGVFAGIEFVDDSLGTVVSATVEAIKAQGSELKTLITGGFHSGQDYSTLIDEIENSPLRHVVLLGETGSTMEKMLIEKKTTRNVFKAKTMEEAVGWVYENAPKNSICLMSCAAPSFGLFKNYKDRAEQFTYYVKKLATN
jgi:UDP-N-acetylmuramoyl-L-alanine---L-glutamate ligase